VSYLGNIARFSRSGNLGGIVTLKVARAEDVLSIPEPVGGVIPGDITFLAGRGFATWSATLETKSLRSTARSSREGTIKSNQLSFLLPKDRSSIKTQLDNCESDEFIVLYRDGNGNQILFGRKESPVRFQYDYNSGDAFASFNNYSCTFFYDGPDNRFFYAGSADAQPPGTAPSIVQYTTGDIIATLSPSDELVVTSDFEHSFTLIPGASTPGVPAIVRWSDGSLIAALQPGDILVVDTDFTFDFELIADI